MRSMPAFVLSFTALLVCGCAGEAGAGNEHRRSGAELLQAAEQSFSSIPFGTTLPPPDLNLLDDGGCVDGRGECTYLDANHVQHYFGADGGELVVKSIMAADVSNQPIAALGIGTARALDEVVERVQLFMPEAEVTCDEQLDGNETICGASLGDGWIRLFFDPARQLTEARIDAYHFT
ncbi:hypothetical protein GRI89_12600 [Altererythrobacter salegens]|uniref:Uncharacterized protein n=1 Tax=Croceibacterium salegens TaxID=1737568 RepID=A0A6I4SYB2_9SPHN|nr:hypothetical protein [Croceibacterium salegens]MXO60378.1 hypothetical protein [Croceibacterium salegens]